jgi:hypothetical protein
MVSFVFKLFFNGDEAILKDDFISLYFLLQREPKKYEPVLT